MMAWRRLAAKNARCAQVILTPDDNNIKVFRNGNSKGFNTSIPFGGHSDPISTAGAKDEWK